MVVLLKVTVNGYMGAWRTWRRPPTSSLHAAGLVP